MGNWHTSIFTRQRNIALLGINGSGKKSIIKSLGLNEYQANDEYHLFSEQQPAIVRADNLNLVKLDLDYYEEMFLESLQTYKQQDILVFVIDSSEKSQIQMNKYCFEKVLELFVPKPKVVLFMLNKTDQSEDCITAYQLVEQFELEKKMGKMKWNIIEASAKMNWNIKEGFEWAEEVMQKIENEEADALV